MVNIDTTVQEKDPTGGDLTDTARRMLVCVANQKRVKLMQSFKVKGCRALFAHCRLKHAEDWKRGRKFLHKLCTYLGRVIRVIRDVERKAGVPSTSIAYGLGIARKVLARRSGTKSKIVSVHAPET